MKKKKLAVIGIAGMLSATPASAQTFYQCMPITCPEGEYVSGGKCLKCPANYYCEDSIKIRCSYNTYSNAGATSCQVCPAGSYCDSNGIHQCAYGTYSLAGNSKCVECESMTYYQGPGGCESNRNKFIKHTLKVGGQVLTNCLNYDSKCGHKLTHHDDYGFDIQFDKYALSCDRYTGKTYYFFNSINNSINNLQIQSYADLFGGGSAEAANCENNPKTCAYSITGNNSDGKPSGYILTGNGNPLY